MVTDVSLQTDAGLVLFQVEASVCFQSHLQHFGRTKVKIKRREQKKMQA